MALSKMRAEPSLVNGSPVTARSTGHFRRGGFSTKATHQNRPARAIPPWGIVGYTKSRAPTLPSPAVLLRAVHSRRATAERMTATLIDGAAIAAAILDEGRQGCPRTPRRRCPSRPRRRARRRRPRLPRLRPQQDKGVRPRGRREPRLHPLLLLDPPRPPRLGALAEPQRQPSTASWSSFRCRPTSTRSPSSKPSTLPRTSTASTPPAWGCSPWGRPSFVPATPAGILRMLLHLGIDPDGKTVVICGRSNIVGKPLALLLVPGGQARQRHHHLVPHPHPRTSPRSCAAATSS